ncbi:MAG: histidine biosynthesis protein [Firmicutes bacterium]|jgi:hypothetical protein|nr:histidine biosynthesis protein [Bacillota bacterium]
MRAEAASRLAGARHKLQAIFAAGRPALMLGGIMGTDMRIARAAFEAGVRIFEPNHPAMALQMGLGGVTTMNAAEKVRHLVPMSRMVDAVRGLRAVCGDEVFITVGFPGTFTEEVPVPLSLEDVLSVARAGADCLHTHKSCLEDVGEIVSLGHRAGLLVEAYITADDNLGVQAPTDEALKNTVKEFERIGVDLIGLTTGMTYKGQSAGGFARAFLDRIKTFTSASRAFRVLEGGIRRENIGSVKDAGLDIVVVSTALDQEIASHARRAIEALM